MPKNLTSQYHKALNWIKKNTLPEQGIITTSLRTHPYLEVTGYLIPTLLSAGEHSFAQQYAEFLSYMQRPSGAFNGGDGKEYVFDTGQALRGLVKASMLWDQFKDPAIKAADYLVSVTESNGRIPSIYKETISENVHVFVLPALLEAGMVLDKPHYIESARKSTEYYKSKADILDLNVLIHFLSYIIDGFIDMGEVDFVRPVVDKIFASQKSKGNIPAFPHVSWVCSTGLAQLAIIGYKLSMIDQANRVLAYVGSIQNKSGGFYGSYGLGGQYFPKEEISWANKFFIDAIHTKISTFFNSEAHIFPEDVTSDDGRLKSVRSFLGDLENTKILDAGCGKGRFAGKIKEAVPTCEVHGVDLSHELLTSVPESIISKQGSILNLPYVSRTFDAVFCIEALEHTIRIEKSIEELCRVLKDGGKIIIIDKNVEKLGRLKITDFEQWFDKSEVKNILSKHCGDVRVEEISYAQNDADGLFLAWSGVKGSITLSSSEWNKIILKGKGVDEVVDEIQKSKFPVWVKPLLQYTAPNESIMEFGSGTGFLSTVLAFYNRNVHCIDYSEKNLEYAKEVFSRLGLSGHFHLLDMLKKIPFDDNFVDWSWSSGVLEHFTDDQILVILKESVRISKKGVLCLVPNANALFYRTGKYHMEQTGTWPFGNEDAKFTMKHFFEKAGLKNIQEYSLAPYQSLKFWQLNKKAQKESEEFINSLDSSQRNNLNQGYLLFTYGEK